MTPEELKALDPECFAAVVTLERARVERHLKFGAQCIDYGFAHANIRSGAEFTDDVRDYYADAIVNRRSVDVRQQESDAAGVVIDGAKKGGGLGGGGAATAVDEVAAELEKLMGPPRPETKATTNVRT